jgi:hypothetical protein
LIKRPLTQRGSASGEPVLSLGPDALPPEARRPTGAPVGLPLTQVIPAASRRTSKACMIAPRSAAKIEQVRAYSLVASACRSIWSEFASS